jgi:predicted DNA-binding transcriptional regulator YafY
MPKVAQALHTRPPLERMFHIHERIKGGKFPNCTVLARDIEVSTRTIKRDIDFMTVRLNLPIAYDPRRYGYHYTKPVDQFPSVPVSEAEVFALLVAHKALAQYRGTPFEHPLETAFRRLTSQLNGTAAFTIGNLDHALSFRPFGTEETDVESFQILSRGLQEGRVIRFLYRGLGAEKAQGRRVQPFHVACVENRWYLIAHDLVRDAMRTFALTRMRQIELLPETFARPRDFKIDEYLKGSLGIYKAGDDFEVVLHFDKWAGQLVRERRWHVSQELTDLPGGGVRLRLRLNNIEEVERWVLSWGTHATVIRPKMLIERLRKIGEELLARYRD